MKELRDFYEYKGRLMHTTQNFLGYDPMISIPLPLPDFPRPGETKEEYAFVVGSEVYRAVVSGGLFYGPLRGYKQIVVFLGGERIICHKHGGHGHGTNYATGQKHFIAGDMAFVAVEGNALRNFKEDRIHADLNPYDYYLLVFKGIIVPSQYPADPPVYKPCRELYFRDELESQRQRTWEGRLELPAGTLKVTETSVPGFDVRSFDGRTAVYRRRAGSSCLKRKELSIGEESYVFEHPC